MMFIRSGWYFSALGLVYLTVSFGFAGDTVVDVKGELDQHRKQYQATVAQFKRNVGDYLDRKEDAARETGNKKAVEQVKAERKAFESNGDLPPGLPAAAKKELLETRSVTAKALALGVKSYIRLKMDAEAEAVENERQTVLVESAALLGQKTYLNTFNPVTLNSGGQPKGWFRDRDDPKLHFKFNDRLAPRSIYTHAVTGGVCEASYNLGGRWLAFRATVGIQKTEERQHPASPVMYEVLGDGKSLWKSKQITQLDEFESCDVRVNQVRILTLRVHCPGANAWARTTWFDPYLIE